MQPSTATNKSNVEFFVNFIFQICFACVFYMFFVRNEISISNLIENYIMRMHLVSSFTSVKCNGFALSGVLLESNIKAMIRVSFLHFYLYKL